jgi:predicted chitinase
MRYQFDVEILNQNPFQVQLDTYEYSYREYDEFVSVPDSLGEKIGFELEDYYEGNFFTFSGLYPDLRGPGGGGYSASSFVGNYSDFRTVDKIGGGKDFSMYFDKNILDNVPGSIEKISSDIKFIIESAFKNSTPNKNEVYIDTIFTRDNTKIAESNQIRIKKVNGVDKEEQNPNYTPNGKTYSIPITPDFELRGSKETSNNTYYITYLIKEIVPTPKKEETIQDPKQDENTPVTVSEESKINSYVFNVEKVKTFSNSNFGDLVIVESKLAEESSSEIVEDFVFSGEDDDELLDDEFRESEFVGSEEELISFSDEDGVNLNIDLINSIKGNDPENPDSSLATDNYKYPISKDVDANIKVIIKVAKQSGLTNKFAIAAMLAISKKESGIVPQSEGSYAKTSAERIKKIFKKFRKFSDSEVDRIKKNAQEFFDIVYGGMYKNGPDEGFKYRGRGLNQITFKGNYESYKKRSGYDIIKDPDLLNTIDVAAKCLVEYFKNEVGKANNDNKSRYNFTDINSFKNLNDATGAFYHANAGWGKPYSEIVADSTGGRAKAFKYVGNLYETYKDQM